MKAFEEIVEIFYLLKFIEIEITDIINVIKDYIILTTEAYKLLINFPDNPSGYYIPYRQLTGSETLVTKAIYTQLPKILTDGMKNASKNVHRWISYVNILSCEKITKNPVYLKKQATYNRKNSLHTEIKCKSGNYIVQLLGGKKDSVIVGSCEIDIKETMALMYSYMKNSLKIHCHREYVDNKEFIKLSDLEDLLEAVFRLVPVDEL